MADRAFLTRLSRELTDQGKLIEAGWIGLRIVAIPLDATELQLQTMRMVFFAGSQHLFGSIMSIMQPDAEPTDKDMQRLDLIDRELKAFIEDFKIRNCPTERKA